jgi:hypothetical protein
MSAWDRSCARSSGIEPSMLGALDIVWSFFETEVTSIVIESSRL